MLSPKAGGTMSQSPRPDTGLELLNLELLNIEISGAF
jgi:hypothetical protein